MCGVLGESWGSLGGVLEQHSTHRKPFTHRRFRRLGGVVRSLAIFACSASTLSKKYSYQPIPQLAQPVPRLGQPVPHLYQLYKKKSGAPLRSSALTIHECLLLILVLPVVATRHTWSRSIFATHGH